MSNAGVFDRLLERGRSSGSYSSGKTSREFLYPRLIDAVADVWCEILREKEGSVLDLLAPSAVEDIKSHIARSVSEIVTPTLYAFEKSRIYADGLGLVDKDFDTNLLNANGGLQQVLDAFPLLKTLVLERFDQLLEFYAQFLKRLSQDRHALREMNNSDFALVRRIQTELSDPHQGHTCVIKIEPQQGPSFLYKPRNISAEASFRRFLQDIMPTLGIDIIAPEVIERGSYGWSQFLEHKPCKKLSEVRNYYTRIGQLGFVLYLLGATDFHYENLVAYGEFPVAVDLETLFHVDIELDQDANESAQQRVWGTLKSSVLASGYFPNWAYPIAGGSSVDISAICGTGAQPLPWFDRFWKRNDVGHPECEEIPAFSRPAKNQVKLGNEVVVPSDYLEQIIEGFSRCYDSCLRSKGKIAESIRSAKFEDCEFRYIHRDTLVYKLLLADAYSPNRLTQHTQFASHFEALSNSLAGVPKVTATFVEAEIDDLKRGDIPVFRYSFGERRISNSDGKCLVKVPPISPKLNARLMGFSEKDKAEQLVLIRTSFSLHDQESVSGKDDQSRNVPTNEASGPAFSVVDKICKTAFLGNDGSVSWLGFEPVSGHGRARLAPLGIDFYSGSTGIGVLLAAQGKIAKNPATIRMLDLVVEDICSFVEKEGAGELVFTMGHGIFTGFPSIIYGLTLIGQLTSDPKVLRFAERFACEYAGNLSISEESNLDFMTGLSGCLVFFLSMYELGRQSVLLNAAKNVSDVVLNNIKELEKNSTPAPFGLAHGNLGPLLAVSNYAAQTRDENALERLLQMVDLIFNDIQNIQGTSWCNGMGGLSQVYCSVWRDHPKLRNRLPAPDEIFELLALARIEVVENLCCGELARISAMRRIIKVVSSDKHLAAWLEEKLAETEAGLGQWYRTSLISGAFNPSFFQGHSGISYTTLRKNCPDLPFVEVGEIYKTSTGNSMLA